jgi:hypothetical protein
MRAFPAGDHRQLAERCGEDLDVIGSVIERRSPSPGRPQQRREGVTGSTAPVVEERQQRAEAEGALERRGGALLLRAGSTAAGCRRSTSSDLKVGARRNQPTGPAPGLEHLQHPTTPHRTQRLGPDQPRVDDLTGRYNYSSCGHNFGSRAQSSVSVGHEDRPAVGAVPRQLHSTTGGLRFSRSARRVVTQPQPTCWSLQPASIFRRI